MSNSIKDTIISTISKTMPFIPGYINYSNEGICIDTSNRRIGFDTFDPSYTIDLSISDAIINFKDNIQLKGTGSFLVNPINSITATTSETYKILTSTTSKTQSDFSSIQAAPIIYNPNYYLTSKESLYPSNNDIDLGTPDLCWNNIYCKKMYGSTVILDIVCSSIDCSGNIDCSTLDCSGIICDGNIDCSTLDCSGIICDGNITSHKYNIYQPYVTTPVDGTIIFHIEYKPTGIADFSCFPHINAGIPVGQNTDKVYRGSIAFVNVDQRGMCTLFGSDGNNLISDDLSSKNISMIINGGTGIDKPRYVGIGTLNPSERLEVSGNIIAGQAFLGDFYTNYNHNHPYAVFGNKSFVNTVDFSNQYALMQSTSDSQTILNSGSKISFKLLDVDPPIMDISLISSVPQMQKAAVIINQPTTINNSLTVVNNSIDCSTLTCTTLTCTDTATFTTGIITNSVSITAGGNIVLNGANITTTGDINVGSITGTSLSITSGGSISTTGEIHAGSITGTSLSITSGGSISTTGEIQAGSISTTGEIDVGSIKTNTITATDTSINITSPLILSGLTNCRTEAAGTISQWWMETIDFNSNSEVFPAWSNRKTNSGKKITPIVIDVCNGELFKYESYSDKKLKTNIEPFKRMLDLVIQLNPVYFTWIDSSCSDYGFIAQELEELMPEIITYNKDDNGEITRVYSMEAPIHFISVLTKAIQDLAEDKDTEIAELKAENTELKSENTIFKSKIATLENKVTILEEENNTIKAQLANILERLSSIEN